MLLCSAICLFCAAVLNASSVAAQDEFGKKIKIKNKKKSSEIYKTHEQLCSTESILVLYLTKP